MISFNIPDSTKVLQKIYGQIPPIDGYTVRFEAGTRESFDLYIAQNTQENKYPLIWQVLPDNEFVVQSEYKGYQDVNLLIAVKSNYEKARDFEVIKRDFDGILHLLLGFVSEGLKRSSFTNIIGDWRYQKFPNYYENGKSVQTDIINVVKFTARVEFDISKCFNAIIWG